MSPARRISPGSTGTPTRPGKPQFVAVFTDWDFSPHIAATTFVADLQPGAQKIPFKPEQAAAIQP